MAFKRRRILYNFLLALDTAKTIAIIPQNGERKNAVGVI